MFVAGPRRFLETVCALSGRDFSFSACDRSAAADAARSRRKPRKVREPLPGWLVNSELLPLFGAAFSPPGRGKGRIPAVEELRSTRLPANRHTMLISQSRFCVTAFGCRSEKCSRGGSVREPHDHQSAHTLLPFCSTAPGHQSAAWSTVGGSGETSALRVRHEERGTPRFQRL